MEWFQAVEKVAPYVVKIETPRGHGTGFLCLYNGPRNLCGIATAYHVVEHADAWQEPIRLVHKASAKAVFLSEGQRVILTDQGSDSAVILFPTSQLNLPEELIPMIPAGRSAKVGVEVGWLGYPAVTPQNLCFFTGSISACTKDAYFIDGVAINGVSGGPVFHRKVGGDEIYILGTISAYYPNVRGTGDTLPGLSFAQGVAHFHDTIAKMRSLDEARKSQEGQSGPRLSAPAAKRSRSPRAKKSPKTAKAKPSRKRRPR